MKRFWILLRTELLAWRRDPISALGGFVPTLLLLTALGLMFGGPLSFNITVVNRDAGPQDSWCRQIDYLDELATDSIWAGCPVICRPRR